MERFDLGNIFQGISTLLQADSAIMYARIGLILLGILLVYLGRRGVLEPLVMIPMGLGMAAVKAEAPAAAILCRRGACPPRVTRPVTRRKPLPG